MKKCANYHPTDCLVLVRINAILTKKKYQHSNLKTHLNVV